MTREQSVVIKLLGTAVTAFGLGFGAYDTMLRVTQQEAVTKETLIRLRADSAKLDTLQSLAVDPKSNSVKLAHVVFVDTYARHKAYRSQDQVAGLSNAHFLVEQIGKDTDLRHGLEVAPPFITKQDEVSCDPIKKMPPALLVIHRSAFSGEDQNDDGNQKLTQFIACLRDTRTVVLVYSRQAFTDGAFAQQLEGRTGLTNRIFVYQFRAGNPFDDVSLVRHFLNTVHSIAVSIPDGVG